MTWTLLFDLDDTLVITKPIEHLRTAVRKKSWWHRDKWQPVYDAFNQTIVEEDTNDLLQYLEYQDYQVGVVTSSPRKYAERLLAYHDLFLPVLSAFQDTEKKKPDPAPILNAMEKLEIVPEETIYLGNDKDDVAAAFSAGCTPILLDRDLDYFGTEYTKTLVRKGGYLIQNWADLFESLSHWEAKFSVSVSEDWMLAEALRDDFGPLSVYGQKNLKKRRDLEKEGYDIFFNAVYYPPDERDGISERDRYISELIYSKQTFDNMKKDYQKPAKRLLPEIESWLNPAIPLLIIPVPSRIAGNFETGESMITDLLCDRNPTFLRGTHCLQRVETVPRYSYYNTHLETIRFDAPTELNNVVIIDNVVSSGGTFKASIDKVREAGAKSVIGIAVAKTRGRDED